MDSLRHATVEGARVVIPGVDRYRVPEPLFESVQVVLAKRARRIPPTTPRGFRGRHSVLPAPVRVPRCAVSRWRRTTSRSSWATRWRCSSARAEGGSPTAILVGPKVREFDARAAEVSALQEAVRHGYSRQVPNDGDRSQWRMLEGTECYQRWSRDIGTPDRKRGMGDSYCYGIGRRTHRSAAGFLREIGPRYPVAETHLETAATSFEKETDVLATAESYLGRSAPVAFDTDDKRTAAAVLSEAADAYASGIAAIEQAIDLMADE